MFSATLQKVFYSPPTALHLPARLWTGNGRVLLPKSLALIWEPSPRLTAIAFLGFFVLVSVLFLFFFFFGHATQHMGS